MRSASDPAQGRGSSGPWADPMLPRGRRSARRGWCPGSAAPPVVRAIDVPGGGDQADVAERLREVAHQLAGGDLDLLGEQAKVVGVAGEAVEELLGAFDLARLRQALRKP